MKSNNDKNMVKNQAYYNELFRIIRKAGSRRAIAEDLEISISCISNWLNEKEQHIPSAYNSYMLSKLYKANQNILRGKFRTKLISTS